MRPPGTQSALPLSYHQEPSAPNTALAVAYQGEIRSRTYVFVFSLWQVQSKTKIRCRKLRGLGQPSEVMLTTPGAASSSLSRENCRRSRCWLCEQGWSAVSLWAFVHFSKMLSPEIACSKRQGVSARRLFPTETMF